jgi:hypothetical protein
MSQPSLSAGATTHYRGRSLALERLAEGWTVVLLSKAGHAADVVLHTQLGQCPWAGPEEALAAAHHCIDEMAEEENSY